VAFKPKAKAKSPDDLMGLLVNSKVQTENNALYQTIFGLISIQSASNQAFVDVVNSLQLQINAIDTKKDPEIPPFFFMGSS